MSFLELTGIVKRFGQFVANQGVDFSVHEGEIHALVGENGAGKTTLMNVLYGLYRADAGTMTLGGKRLDFRSPSNAISAGIGMVHQHFMLIPPLSVAENIVLGQEPKAGIFFNKKQALGAVEEISARYGLQVDPGAAVSTLSVGAEQRVEILKLLYRKTRVLIFDEPTAVLTPQETRDLFKIFNSLQREGKTILFISHKLKEVMGISNRITVMRQGKVTGVLETAKTSEREIARLMVGREVVLSIEKEPVKPGPVMLEVKNLSVRNDRGLPAVRDVSFEVRAGEIFGMAGVAGNGQTELVEALTGLRAASGGTILLKGQDVTQAGADKKMEAGMAHILGIAHVPEDRHKRGLILDYPVSYNLILGSHGRRPFARNGLLSFPIIESFAREKVGVFDIRPPDHRLPARALSGGNQQKVVIARELSRDPVLLVVAQPTRGVDVGGIEFIHRQLVQMQRAGKAILLVSLELDEILSLSDRIGVLYEGKLMKILSRPEADEELLGLLMAGVTA